VSTLTGQQKGSYPTPPIDLAFPTVYADNFENYTVGQEANYFMDQTGVWEVSADRHPSAKRDEERRAG
jgi:hypothetical protein